MKIHVLSDLHLEHFGFASPKTDADVVILAGDISAGVSGLRWAAETFPDKPVIYVPGNHEPYGYELTAWRAFINEVGSQAPNVGVFDGGELGLTKDGERNVRILGVTLWTDFALYGADKVEACGAAVQQSLRDYDQIRLGNRKLTWRDTRTFHEESLAWLKEKCQEANLLGEKVVVVTHHAPSIKSSLKKYMNDPVTAGFISNLEAFAAENVDVWVHGHTHNSADYKLGRCRVVANPRGYPMQRGVPNPPFENAKFNPGLVIEV